jgi:hypothetical protein
MLRTLLFGIEVVAKDDKRAGRDPRYPDDPVYMEAYDRAALQTPYQKQ